MFSRTLQSFGEYLNLKLSYMSTPNELSTKVERLSIKVQRIMNFGWVIGMIALFFGISGGIGWTIMSKATSNIGLLTNSVKQLRDSLDILNQKIRGLDVTFSDYIRKSEAKIDTFIDQRKQRAIEGINRETSLNRYLVKSEFNTYRVAVSKRIAGIHLQQEEVDPIQCKNPSCWTYTENAYVVGWQYDPGHGLPLFKYRKTKLIVPER
jgi:hypothetical protein